MGDVIAFINSKGGVGKSTLSVHLTAKLLETGAEVVLVDADVQASSSMWLKQAAPDAPWYRVQSPDEMLDLVPRLRSEFRYVIVDGPAGLSEITRTALFVSNLAFLPCGPSALDLWAATDVIRVVRQVQGLMSGLPTAVLVPNKLQSRRCLSRLSRELLATADTLGLPILRGLRLRDPYADAAGQGTVVWRMGRKADTGAKEMNILLEEILSYGRTQITGSIAANG